MKIMKVKIEDRFHTWLFEACELKANKLPKRNAHEVYEYVDIPIAKLCFLDGMSPLEFLQEIKLY